METLGIYIVDKLKALGVDSILQKEYLMEIANRLLQYRIIMNWISIFIGVIIVLLGIFIFRYGKKNADWERDSMGYWITLVMSIVIGFICIEVGIETLLSIRLIPEIYIINYLK